MSLSRDIAESYVFLIKEGKDAERVANATLSFLKENNLWALQEKVLAHVASIEKIEKEYQTVDIVFADDREEKHAKDVTYSLSGSSDVEFSVKIDEALIGGFKARYKGKEWDASIDGVLERLRANLKTN